ncbi:MAG: hypothetical protein LIO57_10175 [Oscillospiraceae bacterium]|nr:hypothetical protein [Oscillospiraceae bacterium]
MPRKQIVFVIVEGPSDETALSMLLSKVFSSDTVFLHVMRRDITTERGVKPDNILSKIGGEVQTYAKNNHFARNHFKRVIHIVDMDGAYIPNENIIEDAGAVKTFYSPTSIRTRSKDNIMQRNRQKRENLDKLSGAKCVWGSIPYSVYYMSCNLDHVLHNKQNSDDEAKERDAFAFARKYKDDIPAFLDFLSRSDFSVMSGYAPSWAYIKDGLHSLERHTNLALCLPPLAEKE